MTDIFKNIAGEIKDNDSSFFAEQQLSDNYFELEFPTSSKTAWQIDTFTALDNDNSLHKRIDANFGRRSPRDKMPDISLSNLVCELYKSAKITDFISGGIGINANDLILNQKTKELLSAFNLGNHKFYPLNVSHSNVRHIDYFYLRFFNNASPFVDYSKSSFYSQEGLLNYSSRKVIPIDSDEDLCSKQKQLADKGAAIYPKELYLLKDFPSYDIFTFGDHLILKTFVSKRLKSVLDNNQITGVTVTPTRRVKN